MERVLPLAVSKAFDKIIKNISRGSHNFDNVDDR